MHRTDTMRWSVCKQISPVFWSRTPASSWTHFSNPARELALLLCCHVHTCLSGTWRHCWSSTCTPWTFPRPPAFSVLTPRTAPGGCAAGDYPPSDWSRSRSHWFPLWVSPSQDLRTVFRSKTDGLAHRRDSCTRTLLCTVLLLHWINRVMGILSISSGPATCQPRVAAWWWTSSRYRWTCWLGRHLGRDKPHRLLE